MDIQSRKIAFVQAFLQLQNEELLSALEDLLKGNEPQPAGDESIQPMTEKELDDAVELALQDSLANRVVSANDLKNQIASW